MKPTPWRPAGWLVAAFAACSLTCGGENLQLPDEGAPAKILLLRGDGQTGVVGQLLPDSLLVQVVDSKDRPVVGHRVVFTLGAGAGGSDLIPDTATTNADGHAGARWMLGTAAGTQRVQARVIGSPLPLTRDFSATAVAGPAAAVAELSGNNQTGTVGNVLAAPIVVKVTDQFGNPVQDVAVSWSASNGGTVSASSVPTEPDGTSQVNWTLGGVPGAQTALAGVQGLSGSPVTFTAIASVGMAGKLTITTQPPATARSGIMFTTTPEIQLRDASDNPVNQAGVAITVAIASGGGGGNATLIGNTVAATNGTGLARFTSLGISGPLDTYTLNFSGVNLSGVTSNGISLTAGAPAALSFTVQPGTTPATATIAPPIQVAIVDAVGNTVSTATNQVTIGIGNNPSGGTLSGTKNVSAAFGVATFSNLSIDRAGPGYTLTATAAGLTPATSSAFDITTGAAAKLAFITQPSSSVASGQVFPQQPVLQLQDAGGNPVAQANVSVAAALTSGSGTVGGTSPVLTDGTGKATFTNLSISGPAGPKTLTFTAVGVSGTVSANVTVGAGAAAAIAVNAGDNQSAPVGTAVAVDPAVIVTDGSGNPVSGVAVTFAVASGGGSVNPTTPISTNSSGIARVNSWTLGAVAGTNTLTATAAGTGITGNPVTFTATGVSGSAGQLEFIAQPTSVVVGENILPAVQVEVQDASGNRVPTATNPVTIVIANNPSGATLSGAGPVNAVNGVATFPALNLNHAGNGYTLSAISGGLISAPPSNAFNVTKAATSVAITSNLSAPTVVGEGFSVSYTVTVDPPGAGNPVGSVIVSDGSASCTGSVSGGSCTLVPTSAGAKTITASYAGNADFTGSTSSGVPHDVNKAATTTTITAHTPDPSVVGQPYTVNFSVTVNAPGGGTPTGNVTVTDQTGSSCTVPVSTGSCQIASTSAGGKTLRATYAGSADYLGSSDTDGHQVLRASTTTTIVSDNPDPSNIGQVVTVAFTVTANPPGSGTPTGTVTVSDGVVSLCSASVAVGSCTFTLATQGSVTLRADYPQTANFEASFGTEPHTVNAPTSSTTTVASSLNPSVFGQSVTFTAMVSPSSATGTVQFKDGASDLGSPQTLTSGSAQFTTAGLSVGSHTINAVYSGDASHSGSTDPSPVTQIVNKANTSTAITSDLPDPSAVGQPITIDFTVTAVPPGAGTPTGSVTVSDGTDSCVGSVSSGSCTWTPSTSGSKTLTATYAGDANFNSSSDTESHNVSGAATTTSVSSSVNPSVFGQLVTFTATVSSGAPGTPTGTIQFKIDGSNAGAPVALSGGSADFPTSSLSVGSHTIEAVYSGDGSFAGSTGALPGGQTVNQASTTTTIDSHLPEPSDPGQAVTVTFTVTVDAPGAGTPTGNVTVTDGVDSCQGTVAAGTCDITLTTSGTRTLTATYDGDTNFATSASTGVDHVVN